MTSEGTANRAPGGICAPDTPCGECLENEAQHYLNYEGCTLDDGEPCGSCRRADREIIEEVSGKHSAATIVERLNTVGPVQLAQDLGLHIHGMKFYMKHIHLRWEDGKYVLTKGA